MPGQSVQTQIKSGTTLFGILSEIYGNRLGGLSLPRNSVSRLTNWLDLTLIVLTGQ